MTDFANISEQSLWLTDIFFPPKKLKDNAVSYAHFFLGVLIFNHTLIYQNNKASIDLFLFLRE